MDKLRNHNQWLPIPQMKNNFYNGDFGYNKHNGMNSGLMPKHKNDHNGVPQRQQHMLSVPPVQLYQYWHTYPHNQDDVPIVEASRARSKKKEKRKQHPIATTGKQYNPKSQLTFREMVRDISFSHSSMCSDSSCVLQTSRS